MADRLNSLIAILLVFHIASKANIMLARQFEWRLERVLDIKDYFAFEAFFILHFH